MNHPVLAGRKRARIAGIAVVVVGLATALVVGIAVRSFGWAMAAMMAVGTVSMIGGSITGLIQGRAARSADPSPE